MILDDPNDRIGNAYLGNPGIKKAGVQIPWTLEKIKEYKKCSEDPIYFIETYMKVISLDDGLVPFKLYDYQRKMIEHYNNESFSITLSCRQSGKTITTLAYVLWYSLFNADKTIFLLANKGDTARDVLFARYSLALENIPFYLQPGCKVLNRGSVEFESNTKIFARATSSSSIRGSSANMILLDELAFVERAEEFYQSTFPVISSGKNTKILISSTANGIGNLFHRLWTGAVTGTNEYAPFTVDWWHVPGRDEEWKRRTIANTSQQQFDQEFANSFLGSGNTLIDGNTLLTLQSKEPLYTLESGTIRVFKEPIKDHDYIMTVDVSRGRGQDYSTFNIIDITTKPFEQVCVFQDNLISPLLLPTKIFKYANLYNEAYVLVEANDNGFVVSSSLFFDLEYDNQYTEMKAGKLFVGVEMNKKIKAIGCSNMKDLVQENRLIIFDKYTIQELTTFVAKGNSYEAESGNHDDLAMNLVLFGWFSGNNYFKALTDISLKEELFESRIKEIEDELVPFGVIDDGVNRGDDERIPMKEHVEGILFEKF